MKKLNYELRKLCGANRDGSFSTQNCRMNILQLVANQLPMLGFTSMGASSLKPKHIKALVEHWKNENLSVGTIKQRMSVMRWWAKKIGKPNVVERSNASYGIGKREYISNKSKARILDDEKFSKITDSYVKYSLKLQSLFGLRREESIKFIPAYADKGDYIRLKDTWTKGGKARVMPVKTKEQRELLNEIRDFVGNGALIPPDRNYIQQLRIYEKATAVVGLNKMHGLRHAYAQNRYRELTGWACPLCGGPTKQQLSFTQKEIDKVARLTISQEMGHERISVVSIYIG